MTKGPRLTSEALNVTSKGARGSASSSSLVGDPQEARGPRDPLANPHEEEERAPRAPSLENAETVARPLLSGGDRRSGPRAPFADEPAEAKRRRARREVSEGPPSKNDEGSRFTSEALSHSSLVGIRKGSRLSEPPSPTKPAEAKRRRARKGRCRRAQRGPLTNTVARGGEVSEGPAGPSDQK